MTQIQAWKVPSICFRQKCICCHRWSQRDRINESRRENASNRETGSMSYIGSVLNTIQMDLSWGTQCANVNNWLGSVLFGRRVHSGCTLSILSLSFQVQVQCGDTDTARMVTRSPRGIRISVVPFDEHLVVWKTFLIESWTLLSDMNQAEFRQNAVTDISQEVWMDRGGKLFSQCRTILQDQIVFVACKCVLSGTEATRNPLHRFRKSFGVLRNIILLCFGYALHRLSLTWFTIPIVETSLTARDTERVNKSF